MTGAIGCGALGEPLGIERIAAWWNAEARSRHAYATAAALAVIFYMIAYGPGFAFGTSSYWDLPLHDHRAYTMGYRYFLAEPWQWPVFVTHTMNVPYPKSIAFTDSIPAWAFVNKSFATIVPPWGSFSARAFLGLWYGLAFVLQACVGVAILRTLGKRSWAATIITTLMLLAVPAWAFRFFHASLYAQFLLLWALLLYFRTPHVGPASTRLRLIQVGQLTLTALINPYLTVMSLGVFVASLAKARHWRAFSWFPAGVAGIGLAAWLAGYFQRDAKLKMFGFDAASTNALSFFIPRYSGVFGESLWVDSTGYQYEGVAYLGLGFLVLLVAFLPHARSATAVVRRHVFLFAIVIAAWLFALSNHVYVGKYSVVSYKIPSILHWVADQFRSPGRFVWLAMYVLMLFLLKWALTRFATGWKQIVLPLVAIVQLVDVTDQLKIYRSYTRSPVPHLDLAAWRALLADHEEVVVMPSFDCIIGGAPETGLVSTEIQYMTSERTLPINGVYSARPTRDCVKDEREWPTAATSGTLYVVLPPARSVGLVLGTAGVPCLDFAYGRVCTANQTALANAVQSGAFRPSSPPSELLYGTRIEPGSEASQLFLDGNWSWPEGTGRWSQGPVSRLMFRLDGDPPSGVALKMLASSVVCGKRYSQDLEVAINGSVIGTLHFDSNANDPKVPRSLQILNTELLRGSAVIIELRSRDSRAPNEVKCNEDSRKLGVFVNQLWFE